MKLQILLLIATVSVATAQTPDPRSEAEKAYRAAETRAIQQAMAKCPDAAR